MAKIPPHLLLIFLLTTAAVLGCGTLPVCQWQWRFSTNAAARAQVTQISPNSGSPEAFVKRLIIQGGRAAGLPDSVITIILGQLAINVLYTPLSCPVVSVSPMRMVGRAMMMMTTCIIFGNTVTTTCLGMGAPGTSNLILATWSREMWQKVVNKVLRMIITGLFGTHFSTAVATVT
ncbi:hypothetical protein KIN20_024331 [Parelaphostrongylus tenuis]|uniref:Amino acid transporter n=1 Tax=Parelaphostrongylus tenuis TaxID=148309 RepID=A0AAD5QTL6_PARTN|nr:hypothetical protein KIN20_024331 [Parelaphostrongylus tenuis]